MSGDAVSDDDRIAYRRDGVVALRGVLPLELVESLAAPVAAETDDPDASADMSELRRALGRVADPSDGGRFLSGVDHWRRNPILRHFALESPLPRLIADLLQTATLRLYEDSVLVKEPGTAAPTMFHQDLAYFAVDGDQICTTWVPLDAVDRASGALGYVRGSHLDSTEWRPNLFVTTDATHDGPGTDVPDLHADPGDADIVWIDAEPGDVLVHHARTLHGAGPNPTDRPRRAVSVRYCGDDVRIRHRPGGVAKPHHAHLRDGDPLDDAFPRAIGGS